LDKLYEVAVDPERYECLLDSWEDKIGAVRGLDLSARAFHDPEIEAHFERADIFLDRLQDAEIKDDPAAVLAQFENVAACLVDHRMTVEAVNMTARTVFELAEGQRLSNLPLDEFDLGELSKAISESIREPDTATRLFRFRCTARERIIVFQIRPCKLSGRDLAVVATSEVGWPSELDATLQAAFQLSETEIEVVRALVECQSLRSIADQRGRSVETIRSQVRSIMSKTETHSQSELVRITLSLMDVVGQTQSVSESLADPEQGTVQLETVPFQTITRTDGRRLDYVVLGDPNGKPVLFMPGDYGLIRWPASAESQARDDALQVIVPVRAGYGHSSEMRYKDRVRDVSTADIAAILKERGVKRCPIISTGNDSYFSFIFAARYPRMVTALLAYGGGLPFTKPEQFERMEKWHRFILANARYAPHLLPFMVKAGFFLARRIGKRGFIHAVYGNSAADVSTFDHPEVYEAMVSGSEVALSENFCAHRAFSREVISQAREDWTEEVDKVRDANIPVHFINGAQDPMLPELTLEEFRADHPWIDFTVHEDAGQLIFFAKWRDALARVTRYL